jgi:protein-disulfide isomerase
LAVPVRPDRDHTLGRPGALVSLVEYVDFESADCAAAHPVVEAVRMKMGDELQFVFRHFPDVNAHPHAETAAEAAEAAGAQGQFWKMHDLLLETQAALELPDLLAKADVLDLDLEVFATDVTSGRNEPRVREDFLSGVESGVTGTPAFFIDGQLYHDAVKVRPLLRALQRAEFGR